MKKYITEKSKDFSLLDNHTGEILDYNQVKKVSIEEFIMVFFSSYPEILKLEGQKLKILMLCWKYSTFGGDEGNIITNNLLFKTKVREYEPSISDAAIDVAISTLAKKGILRRVCKGQYELNPDYFFKGTLSKRSKLRFSVEVEPVDKRGRGDNAKESFCFFVNGITAYKAED